MKLSNEAKQLRHVMEKAIEDHQLSKAEYEKIIHMATDDGHIDRQELALLKELQAMIENKTIKLVP